MDTSGQRILQSVDRAMQMVQQLKRSGGMTVSELAEEFELSPGTVHAYLATLRKHGLLVKDGQSYRLGPAFLPIGEYVRHSAPLYNAARNQIEELAEKTDECAHLITEHDGRLFALYESFGEQAVGVEYHSRKAELSLNHLHCTAAGKAILAHLSPERVNEIIKKSGMPAVTEKTITNPEDLFQELKQVRDQGYSSVDEEQIQGIRAVGAPILHHDGEVAGAIAVSGPKSRLKGEILNEELPEQVMQAVNICEVNLQAETQSNI